MVRSEEMHMRGSERRYDIGGTKMREALFGDIQVYHGGEDFDLEVKITDKSFGKPSRRMITESVMIEQVKENDAMNSKKEWTYVKLNRVHMG